MTEGSTAWCSRKHGKGTQSAGCSGWVVDLSLQGGIVCGQQRRRQSVSNGGPRCGKAGGAALCGLCRTCQWFGKDGGPAAWGVVGEGREERWRRVQPEHKAKELGLCSKGRESQAGF